MKKTYFIWLGIQFIVWGLASIELNLNEFGLAGICLFFVILFVLPLFREKPLLVVVLFCLQAFTTIMIFSQVESVINPYVLLIHALIMVEASNYLSRSKSLIVMLFTLACAAWILIGFTLTFVQFSWFILYYVLLTVSLIYYQAKHIREQEVRKTNEVLLDEYRRMKRQLVVEEEQARQEERILIGHEIHDSVGHKLTALLMQLEVYRLTAHKEDEETIRELKVLAEQSLEETRQAVRSFKQIDVGGLQGVIRLIRKLEVENYMKINFSVNHGAFAVPLTGEQSFAIYRAVQEALTNIMKHSTTKEAQVMFDSPGGSIFRFEVSNTTTPNPFFQEGYGLEAMRNRLEKVGGTLEIDYTNRLFIVRGSIRLSDWSESND